MAKTDSELTAEIVAAYLSNPNLTFHESKIPKLIADVHEALSKF
ncbi:MucR family transcriptional regulator [Lactococcus lactis]|nr:MucR family transcriptional regulator [Lactococcus lactis]